MHVRNVNTFSWEIYHMLRWAVKSTQIAFVWVILLYFGCYVWSSSVLIWFLVSEKQSHVYFGVIATTTALFVWEIWLFLWYMRLWKILFRFGTICLLDEYLVLFLSSFINYQFPLQVHVSPRMHSSAVAAGNVLNFRNVVITSSIVLITATRNIVVSLFISKLIVNCTG